jgi:hypothetical protein
LVNGRAVPSEGPGMGLRFDEGFIKRHLVEEEIIGNRAKVS